MLTVQEITPEIRKVVLEYMTQDEVNAKIEQVIRLQLEKHKSENIGKINNSELLDEIKKGGFIDELVCQLQNGVLNEVLKKGDLKLSKDSHILDSKAKPLLRINLIKGRAFLDYLDTTQHSQDPQKLSLHLQFLNQRFESNQVICQCEPQFNDSFELSFQNCFPDDHDVKFEKLLSISDAIHIVLLKSNSLGQRSLVSSNFLEWRHVLAGGHLKLDIPLQGVGCENNMVIGILELELTLENCELQITNKDIVSAQVNVEKKRISERHRLFITYAKQWWSEYLSIQPDHQRRLVKVFAQDENGINRFVCSYVSPLRARHLIETPLQGAWFIALFAHESAAMLNGAGAVDASQEIWSSIHTILCRRQCGFEDRAVLLCSLLIGFGLNAYVCIGTKANGGAHAWVVTINSESQVCFWEPSNATRCLHTQLSHHMQLAHLYSTVGCVFNNAHFYANCQLTDSVSVCCFDLQNSSKWKSMSEEAILSAASVVKSSLRSPPINPPSINVVSMGKELEENLKSLVFIKRQEEGFVTVFDNRLPLILSSALATYELEKQCGTSFNDQLFNDAIHNHVPDGYTFKGYPMRCNNLNARMILHTASKSGECRDIVFCHGNEVRLAIAVSVHSYCEDLTSVWVMFATIYKSRF